MKLVEILARDLEQWRGVWLFCAQSTNGQIYFDNKERDQSNFERGEFFEIADDWKTARITRAQWEAERARIAAMEGISAVSQEQANAEAEREKRAQYEQELWDRVAVAYVNGAASDPASAWTKRAMNEHVSQAYDIADAFIAERAKRLKR